MIKFDKNEFLKPQIYSTLDEYETRCNVTKEIIKEIEQLQQQCRKQKEVIIRVIALLNNTWSFESGNKEVDEITYNKKRKARVFKNFCLCLGFGS